MIAATIPNIQYPGISPEMTVADAGLIIFQFHYLRMISNEEGTILGEDNEALHDMRVASRRLRVAVDQFKNCYKKRSVKKLIKSLRKIGRNLGEVRDLDVIIDRLAEYMKDPSQKYGNDLQLFYEYLERKRSTKREKLRLFLGSEAYESSTKFMEEFVKYPKHVVGTLFEMGQLGDFSNDRIETQQAEIDKFDINLSNPTIRNLHKLRIVFKRFRYTVEFFINLLGDEAPDTIEVLKSIQDHLGEKHIVWYENWKKTRVVTIKIIKDYIDFCQIGTLN